jgi:ribonuclease HI
MGAIKIYFDGLCEPVNPKGVAVYAFIAFNERQEEIHHDVGLACKSFTPQATNNFAEYMALLKALEWSLNNKFNSSEVFGDSKLVVNQVNGEWKIRKPYLMLLGLRARNLKEKCSASLTWIPREQNHADRLTQEYYKEYARKNGITKKTISESYGKYRREKNSRLF